MTRSVEEAEDQAEEDCKEGEGGDRGSDLGLLGLGARELLEGLERPSALGRVEDRRVEQLVELVQLEARLVEGVGVRVRVRVGVGVGVGLGFGFGFGSGFGFGFGFGLGLG